MSANQILIWESNPISKQMAALQSAINQYEAVTGTAPQIQNNVAFLRWLKSVFDKGDGLAALMHMPVRPTGGGVEGQDYMENPTQNPGERYPQPPGLAMASPGPMPMESMPNIAPHNSVPLTGTKRKYLDDTHSTTQGSEMSEDAPLVSVRQQSHQAQLANLLNGTVQDPTVIEDLVTRIDPYVGENLAYDIHADPQDFVARFMRVASMTTTDPVGFHNLMNDNSNPDSLYAWAVLHLKERAYELDRGEGPSQRRHM